MNMSLQVGPMHGPPRLDASSGARTAGTRPDGHFAPYGHLHSRGRRLQLARTGLRRAFGPGRVTGPAHLARRIPITRPTCGGRGSARCAAITASTRARTAAGIGAARGPRLSMCISMISVAAARNPASA